MLLINLPFNPEHLLVASPGQSLIYAHIIFNLSLLIIALPLCRPLEAALKTMMPDPIRTVPEQRDEISVLDLDVLGSPPMAIASLKRELLRMMGLVERMFLPMQSVFEDGDKARIRTIKQQDKAVNAALLDMRRYVADIPLGKYSKDEAKTVRGLMEYAIRLKAAGDLLSGQFLRTAEEKRDGNIVLSSDGWTELVQMFEKIRANFKLASNVLISDDIESARLLVMEKTEIKQTERSSRKRHLQRLSEGRADSFESSDVHLETLRALRDLNGHIAAVAYPILYRTGQLLAAGRGTTANAILTLAGMQNVLADQKGYKPVSAEGVAALAPDMIVITTASLEASKGLDAFLARPGIAMTPAARHQRVAVMDDLLILGLGPRTGQAIRELKKAAK
ncbi:MAG: ABC transporter substrate-binding protein [Salinisphaera sp.]|nr:ABC transporter substrate-binding protein [Salinisphaera sp.]